MMALSTVSHFGGVIAAARQVLRTFGGGTLNDDSQMGADEETGVGGVGWDGELEAWADGSAHDHYAEEEGDEEGAETVRATERANVCAARRRRLWMAQLMSFSAASSQMQGRVLRCAGVDTSITGPEGHTTAKLDRLNQEHLGFAWCIK
jgi:hypothetical protein